MPGAAIAATRAGIAALWHGFGRMVPAGIGLELPTGVPGAAGRPHLDICPPSLPDKNFLATGNRIALRPVPYPAPGGPFTRIGGSGPGPLIYLTFGTAFGTVELLSTAIAGCAAQRGDRAGLGAAGRPAAARRPGRAPRRQRNHPRCARRRHPATRPAPGADQFANADALCAVGAGLRLPPGQLTADAVARRLPEYA